MEKRTSKTELTRHEIREKALQALFLLDFNADLIKRDAIGHASVYDNREIVSEDGEDPVLTYLDLLVGGVCSRKAELDEVITNHLGNNWSTQRLVKIDIVILCLVILETLYASDVPNIVTLNEAVELSKKYSDGHSRKLANGVLSNVMKETDPEV